MTNWVDRKPLSTFTLWRGHTLLGRFTERDQPPPRSGKKSYSGVLEPEPSVVLEAVMQARMEIIPGRPFVQHALDGPTSGPGPVALTPMDAEDLQGVGPDLILEIRDEAGKTVNTRMIALQRFEIPDDDPKSYRAANGLSGDEAEIWMVQFSPARPDEE